MNQTDRQKQHTPTCDSTGNTANRLLMSAPVSEITLSPPCQQSLIRFLPWFAAALCWALYLCGIVNRVTSGDSGELVAAAYALGVAHPTGYPLYTLLGHLFCNLPLPLEAAAKMALMSSLFGAGAVFVTIHLGWVLLQRTVDVTRFPRTWFLFTSLAVMAFGLSPLLYSQSRIAEVYSLHVFLMSLSFWFMLRFDESGERRYVSIAAIFMALGLAHHMTTAHLLPAALIYLLVKDPRFFSTRYFPLGLLAGVGGALFYLYLPIADLTTQGFSWGSTSDPRSFVQHVSGSFYRVYLYQNSDKAWLQLLSSPSVLWENISAFSLFIPVGIIAAVKYWDRYYIIIMSYLLLAMIHIWGYNVFDYGVYYIAPLMILLLLALCGLAWAVSHLLHHEKLGRFSEHPRLIILLFPSFLLLVSMIRTFTFIEIYQHDGFKSTEASDYGWEATNIPPDGAIVLHYGDTPHSSSLYYQVTHHLGVNVACLVNSLLSAGGFIVEPEGELQCGSSCFSNVNQPLSWYSKQAEHRWPWLTIPRIDRLCLGIAPIETGSPDEQVSIPVAAHIELQRYIQERIIEQHVGQRRIFTKNITDVHPYLILPHGPYRYVCRGYLQEIVYDEQEQGKVPMFNVGILTNVASVEMPGPYRRRFNPNENVVLIHQWQRKPEFPAYLEWVAPDGRVVERKEVTPADAWTVLETKERPLPLGAWQVRVLVEGREYLNLSFDVVREEP